MFVGFETGTTVAVCVLVVLGTDLSLHRRGTVVWLQVHSVSEESKAEVSEEAKAQARAMALQAAYQLMCKVWVWNELPGQNWLDDVESLFGLIGS